MVERLPCKQNVGRSSRSVRAICRFCDQFIKKGATLYCSNACQCDYQYMMWIGHWLAGNASGGVKQGASRLIRRYLIDRDSEQCSECCWSKVNVKTGKCPIELEHIDGNAENNAPWNVRLLCPNCHALTPTYRALNKGNGRQWRRERYTRVAQR